MCNKTLLKLQIITAAKLKKSSSFSQFFSNLVTCEKKQIDIWYNLLTEYFCCCNFVQFTVSVKKKIGSSELRILGPELMYGLLEQIGQVLATRLIFRNSGLKYELKTTQRPHGPGNLSLRSKQ